ncbi:hypothetical protein JHN63_18845 [Streptomyces sp. MBT65]|uniref:CurL C-terminal domain-containing protein n=1 Tax=Streptomyces sp. MBT65 TaxID=1488395 RepID=UPI00190D6BA6|nr:hypothetical protein [Streptomyces sp. MBT65]MBK3575835.1 hypothetical protein [Streptomyces sp. MBT65]
MTAPKNLPRVLALSARDAEALAELRENLAAWLEFTPDADLDDVALTLATGRERFACRDAVVGTSPAELALLLREKKAAEPSPARAPGDGPLLLLDGTPLTGDPVDLPEVTEALRLATEHGDTDTARTIAVQYGLAQWLRARLVIPRAVHGTGIGAIAAAAFREKHSLADALRTAAGLPETAETESAPFTVDADAPAGTDAVPAVPMVRIGASGPLGLDPADPDSPAHLLAQLWCLGYDVDTTLGRPGSRVRLPGHPFRRRGPGEPATVGAAPYRSLTPYEQRWLFYDLVRHGSSGDHNAAVADVRGGEPPAPEVLREAFAELQRRHPTLRTVFSEPGGRWQARVLPDATAWPVRIADDPDGGPEELREAVLDAARQPMRLRDEPLVRCCLRGGPAHWALALAVYEPLTTTADPRSLLDELTALLGAVTRPPQTQPA